MAARPPTSIRTPRLLLRCWKEPDARLLREALDDSLEELRPWLPWAHAEPVTHEATAKRLHDFHVAFEDDADFVYGIWDADERYVLGGSGLHPRVGVGGLEIGYWVRSGFTGRGIATECARALTSEGLAVTGIERIEIHVDPRNAASLAVPRRLGYALAETRVADAEDAYGEPRDTHVFVMTRQAWTAAGR